MRASQADLGLYAMMTLLASDAARRALYAPDMLYFYLHVEHAMARH